MKILNRIFMFLSLCLCLVALSAPVHADQTGSNDQAGIQKVLDEAAYWVDHINRDRAIAVLDEGLKTYPASDDIRLKLIDLKLESVDTIMSELGRKELFLNVIELAQKGLELNPAKADVYSAIITSTQKAIEENVGFDQRMEDWANHNLPGNGNGNGGGSNSCVVRADASWIRARWGYPSRIVVYKRVPIILDNGQRCLLQHEIWVFYSVDGYFSVNTACPYHKPYWTRFSSGWVGCSATPWGR